MNKTCRKCGVEKPIGEFVDHARTEDGKTSICRSCVYPSTVPQKPRRFPPFKGYGLPECRRHA